MTAAQGRWARNSSSLLSQDLLQLLCQMWMNKPAEAMGKDSPSSPLSEKTPYSGGAEIRSVGGCQEEGEHGTLKNG